MFGSKAGWERANWFAPEGTEAKDIHSFQRGNWFDAVAGECRAVRERVGIIDQTSFAKLDVRGPGAFAALQNLAAANLDKPTGAAVYTQFCNERGGIESDLTICRLDEDHFYVVTGTAFGAHDFDWIHRHLPSDGSVATVDATAAFAVLHVCGPQSRALLERVVDADVSNNALAYARCKKVIVGAARALIVRLSYSGELGFELHVPSEFAAHVYQILWDAGSELGVANVGYRALNSLRLEKGYIAWAADISPDYTPFHAGLGGLGLAQERRFHRPRGAGTRFARRAPTSCFAPSPSRATPMCLAANAFCARARFWASRLARISAIPSASPS